MEKEQRLLSRVMILGLGAAISKAAVFLLMPLYTAILSPEEFGRAELIVNAALLLMPFVSLGASDAVFRFLAGGRNERQTLVAGGKLLLAGFLGFVAILPILSLIGGLQPYLWYLFCYVVAAVLHSFLAHVIRARGEDSFYAIQQIFCTFLTVALSFLLLPVLQLGERGYLMAIFLSDAATALLLAVYLLLRRERGAKQTAESGIIRQMLRYSAPLIPTSALWWSIAYFDRFLLLSYHGAALIGLYAAAGRIPSLLTFGAGIFFEAWQFTALHAPEEQRAALFERIYGMLSAGLVALALALILSSRLLVGYIFAPDFADAALYVPFLVVGAVFSALSSFLGSVYMVKLRSRQSLQTALLGATSNFLLCFWLIPRAGAMGAVAATVVSYFLIFFCRSVQARRMLPFLQHPFKLGLSALLLLVTAWLVSTGRMMVALPVAALTLLPFVRESLLVFRLLWCYFQQIFKKKQKES